MKVYDVQDGFSYSQTHCVVADSLAEAEQLWYLRYPSNTIKEIKVHSEYVIVKGKE